MLYHQKLIGLCKTGQGDNYGSLPRLETEPCTNLGKTSATQNPVDILEKDNVERTLICDAMNGAAIDATISTATIFGMNVKVSYWICVRA